MSKELNLYSYKLSQDFEDLDEEIFYRSKGQMIKAKKVTKFLRLEGVLN